ncbi:MAG: GTP 3',8-cyclase MoaA [Planctomycetota bacterium]|nr:MAG: GTP 3',8-cyclase MoaA [Planctomycetota bacterium]
MAPPLLDSFNRPLWDLRISVTDRCNHRCVFCMPKEKKYHFLPRKDLLSFEEIFRISRILVSMGIRKIRLTGGEPLLRKHLENLICQLKELKKEGLKEIALTTNGIFLSQKAKILKEAGLDRITASLHSLDKTLFQNITGSAHSTPHQVIEGLKSAKEAGLTPIKINFVPLRSLNDQEILEVARFCRQEGFILRFIEYMDVGTVNPWSLEKVLSGKEILEILGREFPLKPLEPQYRGEVAKRYLYEDGKGEIGLITSISSPFCGDCTRLRLGADGKLYTCLFAGKGLDIREPLREGANDKELERLIASLWQKRKDRYSEERWEEKEKREKKEMFQMGG